MNDFYIWVVVVVVVVVLGGVVNLSPPFFYIFKVFRGGGSHCMIIPRYGARLTPACAPKIGTKNASDVGSNAP